MRHLLLRALVTLLAAGLNQAGSLRAQTVLGTVLDETNDVPVSAANVALLARSGARVSESIADSVGRFALEVPEPGEYFIEVERLGYQEMTSLLLQIGVDRDYDLELVIRPQPIQLDELRVTVSSQKVYQLVRQIVGMNVSAVGGTVLLGDDLDEVREATTDIVSMIRWAQLGATITYSFDEGICISVRSRGCATLMLDGAPYPLELFETLDPYSLGALVFLRPVDTGVLFGTGVGAAGVLLLFTEDFTSREPRPRP